MTLYTVRTGFTVFKNGLGYTGGQSCELNIFEFAKHKHKLENTQSTVIGAIDVLINSSRADQISFDDQTADLLPGVNIGTLQAVIEELDRRLENLSPQSSTSLINVETLSADKQLNNSDATIQDLTNPYSSVLNIFLPNSPPLGKQFVIVNEPVSTGNFYINNSNVLPGDRYEIVWQGDRWLEL